MGMTEWTRTMTSLSRRAFLCLLISYLQQSHLVLIPVVGFLVNLIALQSLPRVLPRYGNGAVSASVVLLVPNSIARKKTYFCKVIVNSCKGLGICVLACKEIHLISLQELIFLKKFYPRTCFVLCLNSVVNISVTD